ncbi:hypothetical protein E1286_31790 [Nonomuraea terrae]|uniref:Uncharacterized protein n=1 Tax=Nonomuraea terrae TaxID=2530383 RepID=A0A4R4YBC1_9ACTN|nr:hypothetical protein [Nonomuraea terrae]TDD41938.1 hypothetical protein E1286_31790 [Nonomuraea terrae]
MAPAEPWQCPQCGRSWEPFPSSVEYPERSAGLMDDRVFVTILIVLGAVALGCLAISREAFAVAFCAIFVVALARGWREFRNM